MIIKTEDGRLIKGVEILSEFFPKVKESTITVFAEKSEIQGFTVQRTKENTFKVSYNKINEFYVGFINAVLGFEKGGKICYDDFGVMICAAYNSVNNLSSLKRAIANFACLGYTYVGLYLEDCLEVENEPMFGYMRGRYTAKEIREIVDYADIFGIEIVPYIQTLAHIYKIFRHWEEYMATCHDVNDILLMDEPRTYQLIENEIRTVSKLFKSKKINVGMDESWLMTYGRYRAIHGECNRTEVFMRHAKKVCDICKKYGLNPKAWADMFVSEGKKEYMPDNLGLDIWAYEMFNKKDFERLISNAKKVSDKITFSSAVHCWWGMTPLNEYSGYVAESAVKYTKELVNDFCVTAWGNSRGVLTGSWYGFIKFSNYANINPLTKTELNKKAMLITGYKMDELMCLDLPNKVFDCESKKATNVSEYLFYEDILMGLDEGPENPVYKDYFIKNAKTLKRYIRRNSYYALEFKLMYFLCEVLKDKCDLRIRLYKAYQGKDKKVLGDIARTDISNVIKNLKKFIAVYNELFLKENKLLGYEISNIRLGGLKTRLEECQKIILSYVNGKTDFIEPLEEDFGEKPKADEYNGAKLYVNYEQNVTYGEIAPKVFYT